MPAASLPKYKTPDELQALIDAYFESLEDSSKPTVSGLAYSLGMTTEALRHYEHKDEFATTVKRARQKVEIALEQHLFRGPAAGAIFNLKNNFGWKDRSVQDINANVKSKDVGAIEAIKQLIESKS